MITISNFAHGARGVRVAWQCEEMGLIYQPIVLAFPTPPDFRAKYPPGSVPFVEDTGGDGGPVALGESVAIMLYLAQRYGPTSLLPDPPAARARTLELTLASETTLGCALNLLLSARYAAPAGERSNWSARAVQSRLEKDLARLAADIGDRPYFVGKSLTLADIALATALGMWSGGLDGMTPPGLLRWRTQLLERPAYRRAAAAFAG